MWNDNRKKLETGKNHIDLLMEKFMVNEEFINKKKVAIIDCDGIISTNEFLYDVNGKSMKSYGCYDHEMINFCKSINWKFIFVSADSNGFKISKNRVKDLRCPIYNFSWMERSNLVKNYINNGYITLFIGDSISDINAMSNATIAATVNNAPDLVKEYCDYISHKNGGYGGLADILYNINYKI